MKKLLFTILIIFALAPAAWGIPPFPSSPPDDTAYNATTWDGVTDRAPSKNAVRDKIETLPTSRFAVTDITGQTDDATPATTATAVLAQGGSLIESTLGQIFTAMLTADTGITVSKPVCTSAGGVLGVCAGTEGVWQATDADFTSLAAGISGPVVGLGNGNGYRAIASTDLLPSDEIVAGGGTVDAITANYTIDKTLADKTIARFRSAGANTSTTPSFTPDGLTTRTIVKHGGQALVAGDIGAAGFIAVLQYDLANTRWELLNPVYPAGYADKIGLSGVMTDEQLLCGENTDGTTKAKSCGAKTTYTEPASNLPICRTGAAATGACTNLTDAAIQAKGYTALSAGSMLPAGTAGAAAVTQTNADPNQMSYMAFDGTSDENAVFQWVPPDDWDLGTIKAKFVWTPSSEDNGQTVQWCMRCYAVSDGDTYDVAFSAGEVCAAADAIVTNDSTNKIQKITAATAAITVQGTPALGDVVHCNIFRDVSGDDYEHDAWLLGVRIEYGKNTTAVSAW